MDNRPGKQKVLFVFLDGFGLAPPGPDNPLSSVPMPFFSELTGSRFLIDSLHQKEDSHVRAIDARMGVEGIPQSATGQTALLTGVNAAEVMGFHQPAFPGLKLKSVIDEQNIFKKVIDAGGTATFANAYTPAYFELVEEQKRAHSVTTLSVMAAGIPFRMMEDLEKGEAVYWDITNAYLQQYRRLSLPTVTPRVAGQRLARLGSSHSFTLFECFRPDILGHRLDREGAARFIRDLDEFIGGIVETMDSSTTLVLSSDHGNMEDLAKKPHTENPVPLFACGSRAGCFEAAASITDISPIILALAGAGDVPAS